MKFRYGISLASLLPWSMRSWFWPLGSPKRASAWAQDAGYDFLQVLPLRGISGMEIFLRIHPNTRLNDYDDFHIPARYIEGAWNPVNSLLQALRHDDGSRNMPSTLYDWLFFPKPAICQAVTAFMLLHLGRQYISHGFDITDIDEIVSKSDVLVELCPELEMSPEAIAEKCRADNIGLVLDTEHIYRDRRDFDPRKDQPHPFRDSVDGIFGTIKTLAPHIRVVHVKWLIDYEREDVDKEIIRWLLGFDHRDEIDFIAEYKPVLGPPAKVRQHMRLFLEKMRQLAHDE